MMGVKSPYILVQRKIFLFCESILNGNVQTTNTTGVVVMKQHLPLKSSKRTPKVDLNALKVVTSCGGF